MDLAAGLGLPGCMVGLSLLGTSVFVDMMDDCEDVQSEVLIFQ